MGSSRPEPVRNARSRQGLGRHTAHQHTHYKNPRPQQRQLTVTPGPGSAAVLCAPSRWRLHEKIGRPLADIHDQVPLYADRLAAPVDRFMRALKPGKLAERLNWSVTDDPALFQVEGKHRTGLDPGFTPASAGARLWLRVERQTLSRLPADGFVLFTIRVHSYPLRRVAAQPGAAARLAEAVRAMPPAMAAYKSLPPFRDALLAYLDRAAMVPSPSGRGLG